MESSIPVMKRCKDKKRDFYVVQFIELPFEGIADYVCVPDTWLIVHRAEDQKAKIAYPDDEHPFITRDRAKRKERYDDKWIFYLATVKYESDSYRDAGDWIAARNDNVPLVEREEELKVTDTQSRLTLNKRSVKQSHSSKPNDDPRKPLPGTSTKRPAMAEPKKKNDDKRVKLRKSQSSSIVTNDTNAVPGCSRRDESTIIQDNQSMECVNQTKRTSNKRRKFCVVQFIELPFEGIDDYICVPDTWLVVKREMNQKVVVSYPKNEDPFDTRDRVKRREKCDDKWKYYMAYVKYESDTYRDAEDWIATRNNYRPLVEEKSKITDTQSRFTLNKKLRSVSQSHSSKSNDNPRKPLPRSSIKRPALSEAMKQLDGKRFKLSKSAQSSTAVTNDANAKPGCSRWGQSIIIQDNQSMEGAQTEKTAAASNGELSSSQRTNVNLQESIPMQEQQELNMPLLDVDTPTAVINGNNEVQPSSIMEHPLFSIQVLSQFKNQPESVQEPGFSVASPVEMTSNNQELPTNDAQNSLNMSAHLHSPMNEARCVGPIQNPVDKKTRLMNIKRMLDIAAQNLSNLLDETESSSTRSVAEQSSVIAQNSLQDGQQEVKMHTGNSRDQTAPFRNTAISSQEIQHVPKMNVKRFHAVAAINPRSVLQSDKNIASASQQLPSSSYERTSFFRRFDEHQSSQTQEQYVPHSHQNQYLSTNQDNFGQDLLRGSTENNNDDHRPNSRAIDMRIPSIRQNSTQPSNLVDQTSELPHQGQSQPNQRDSQRQPQRPEIRINISIDDKNNRKIPTLQGVMKKTPSCDATKFLSSIRQIISSTHNTYLRNVQQLQATQSEPVLDNERLRNVMDNEISTNEASVAGRPTAAQNSRSPNHQTHPKTVLKQQMLDDFATLFTQMGSTLRYTCDMYNNLRSSIIENAKLYKKLLYIVERYNTLKDSASNPSSSSN